MLELSTGGYGHASTCLRRYFYSQVERLVPRPVDLPMKMRRGIWVHRALQDHHSGKNWSLALFDFQAYAADHNLDVASITQDIIDMMTGYVEFYKDRPQWECLSFEEPFYLDIPSADLRLRATVDAVVRDRRGVFVVEHKTVAEIPSANWMGCDPQTAIQYLLVERSRRFPQLRGIMFNYLVTQVPRDPAVVGLREKKPRFAANAAETTSIAFDRGAKALSDVWTVENTKSKESPQGLGFGELTEYVDKMRRELVKDAAFYQRYDVYKPRELVMSIMQDVAETVAAIRRAEESGIWRRSFHTISCPRFCTYEALCSQETLNGKPSQALREALFIKDNGKREGR